MGKVSLYFNTGMYFFLFMAGLFFFNQRPNLFMNNLKNNKLPVLRNLVSPSGSLCKVTSCVGSGHITLLLLVGRAHVLRHLGVHLCAQ